MKATEMLNHTLFAFASSLRSKMSALRACRNAPKAGEKGRLQQAATFGFHSAGGLSVGGVGVVIVLWPDVESLATADR